MITLVIVAANVAAVGIGLDALAVEDGGRRPGTLADLLADHGAEARLDRLPNLFPNPFPENVADRLVGREIRRQPVPLVSGLHGVADGVDDPPPVGGRSPQLVWRRQKGFQELPLKLKPFRPSALST